MNRALVEDGQCWVVEFFCSIGYKVYPHGVGVLGEYTLADFLAIREGRTVFVEHTTLHPAIFQRMNFMVFTHWKKLVHKV